MPQDVDQRLTRDVERLCDDLAALIPSMVKPVVDLAWFSVQLYQLTGRNGMAILYLYAFLGFGALSAVTPDFGALAKNVSGRPSIQQESAPPSSGHPSLRGSVPTPLDDTCLDVWPQVVLQELAARCQNARAHVLGGVAYSSLPLCQHNTLLLHVDA